MIGSDSASSISQVGIRLARSASSAVLRMIVAIQVVRLQYYEFFSKFFTETGELFAPFRFEYRKE